MAIHLKPAQRVHLSQVVFEQLLAGIRDGSLRPGDRLPGEYELMRQVSVGRSSVREAIRGLVALGLVETKPGRGAVVLDQSGGASARLPFGEGSGAELQKWAILDRLEVREALEGMAAQIAAERATPMDLAAMERAGRAVEKQAARGLNYLRSNLAFHLAIALASRNSLLTDSVHYVLKEVRLYRERFIRETVAAAKSDMAEHRAVLEAMQHRNPATVVEHRAILEAIRQKNPGAARRAMAKHIQHSAELVRNYRKLLQD